MAKHEEAVANLARGIPTDPDVKLGGYLHAWLYETLPQYVRAREITESTMRQYQDLAEKHIIPAEAPGVPTLRNVGLRELTAPMVRDWQDMLSQKPSGRQRSRLRPGETELPPPQTLKPRTVAYARSVLHKAIADAVRDEVAQLQVNVVDKVRPPKERKAKAKLAITPDQVECPADCHGR